MKKLTGYATAITAVIGAIVVIGNNFWAQKEENTAQHSDFKTSIAVINTKLDNIASAQKELKEILQKENR